MALSALRSLSDAVDLTRALLFPLSPRRWGVLAAVVAFLGPAGTPLPATPQVVDPRLWESLPAAGTIPRRTTAALPEVLVSSLLVGVGALGVLLVGYLAVGAMLDPGATAAAALAAGAVLGLLMLAPLPYPKLLDRDALAMGVVQMGAILVPTVFQRVFPRVLLVAALAYLTLAPRFYWEQ